MSGFVETVRELNVYKLAFQSQQHIFKLTKTFPKEELYSLTDQVRRSSRSIGANVSEAWAKRRYEAHFTSKLTDANGECEETLHWILTAFDCEYISKDEYMMLKSDYDSIGKMLNKMINEPQVWCFHH